MFPWGAKPDPNRANYDATGLGTTSAVGCFPDGVSPFGVEEMSGNVWEWCQSKYADYPYADDRRNLADASDAIRVVRGGSFRRNEEPRALRLPPQVRPEPPQRLRRVSCCSLPIYL